MDVKYFIENRKLSAENRVVLDQLTFGEKVESPTATKLPVLLAVALLKDRNGVIDIDLPISGSIDDPQFSVGGLIVRVIVNLLVKVVTSPFALIGSLVGGGEELSYVEFAPGSAQLGADAQAKLQSIGKALADRPALKLDIAGRVDPEADREGLRKASLERQVRAQKAKELGKAADAADVAVDAAEYPKYLTAAYRAADFPKPRNVIGFVKDLPVPEMETLLLTHASATDEDLRRLANERAQSVKTWLVETGRIAPERVFLVAPNVSGDGIKDKGRASRVDFSLK
ncbi:MAG: ATPase involved in pili bisis [Burkholderiaceae bacterium]|nr:ATPase involved in pili bisis [Burkholderiaceae bacterium]